MEAISGATVSVTTTVKLQLADCPDWSVAVQVSVVVPIGKAVPDGGLQTAVAGQSSENVGENVAAAVHAPGSCGLVMFPGQVITGGTVSVTVTVKFLSPAPQLVGEGAGVRRRPERKGRAGLGCRRRRGAVSEKVGGNVVTPYTCRGPSAQMFAGQVICRNVRDDAPSGRRQIGKSQADKLTNATRRRRLGPGQSAIGHPGFDDVGVRCSQNASRRRARVRQRLLGNKGDGVVSYPRLAAARLPARPEGASSPRQAEVTMDYAPDDVAGHGGKSQKVGAVPHGTRVTAPITEGQLRAPPARTGPARRWGLDAPPE